MMFAPVVVPIQHAGSSPHAPIVKRRIRLVVVK